MMKSLRILGLAAVAVGLAAPGARAERVVFKADIPFDFVVAERHMPSGQYTFVQNSDYPAVVQIYTRDGRHQAIALCQPVPASQAGGVEIVFHRHGSQRFLKVIQRATGSGVSFPKTHAETVAETGAQAATVGMQ